MGDTVRHKLAELAEAEGGFRFITALKSDVGRGSKKVNEDACLDRSEIGLWAVADGVGGAFAGDVASAAVVESLRALEPALTAKDFLASVDAALTDANAAIAAESSLHERGMASTVVALLIFGGHFACAWAGDSRIDIMRNGEFRQLNHDHSEVQELIDQGLLDPAGAEHHPRANVITRAVGALETLEIDHVLGRVEEGDIFLLCSDGLSKVLSNEEISAVLVAHPVPNTAELLVQTTLERGAPDNVTVIVVQSVGQASA